MTRICLHKCQARANPVRMNIRTLTAASNYVKSAVQSNNTAFVLVVEQNRVVHFRQAGKIEQRKKCATIIPRNVGHLRTSWYFRGMRLPDVYNTRVRGPDVSAAAANTDVVFCFAFVFALRVAQWPTAFTRQSETNSGSALTRVLSTPTILSRLRTHDWLQS